MMNDVWCFVSCFIVSVMIWMANICRGGLNSATRFARWPSHPLSMRLQATDQCGSWACHFSMSTPCTMIVAMAKKQGVTMAFTRQDKEGCGECRSVSTIVRKKRKTVLLSNGVSMKTGLASLNRITKQPLLRSPKNFESMWSPEIRAKLVKLRSWRAPALAWKWKCTQQRSHQILPFALVMPLHFQTAYFIISLQAKGYGW